MVSLRAVACRQRRRRSARARGCSGQDEDRCPSGPPLAAAKKMGQASTANAFFPSKLKVNVGDSVTFVPAGFHTVNFPKKGDGPLPLIIPTGQKVAGANDAAGAAFWFNGQDALSLNPAFAAPPASTGARRRPTPAPRWSSPACPRREVQAADGEVHQGRHVHVLLRPAPGHEGLAHGRQEGRDGPDGQAGRRRGQEAGRRGGQGRQGPRQDQPGRQHGRPGRGRQGRRRVLRHGPGEPHRRARHDRQVPDDQGQLRGPHGHVRPGQHRGPVVLPRRHRGLLRVALDRPARASTRATTRRSR